MSTLGLDLGTTGVRAAAFDDRGRSLATAAAPTALLRPGPGLVVFDAEALLATAERLVAEVAARCAVAGDPVAALSFCSQGEAVVPVDATGRALDQVPVMMDRRGDAAARRVADHLGPARIQALTGQPLHPMFSVYKIAAGGPAWRAAAAYRTLGDFVLARWGAPAATDWTLAARTGLFDVDRLRWSDEIVDSVAADAPWLDIDRFSDPVAPGTVLGPVAPAAAARLGLDPSVLLVSGLHDQAAAFLGAGGSTGRTAVFSLGSSDCLLVESPHRVAGITGTGFATYPWRPDHWLTLAGTAAGGWVLEWLAELTGFAGPTDLVAEMAARPPDLVVLPYLAGSGTLDNDPAARGVIYGLTLAATRPELTRAFVEAAGFELASITAALDEVGLPVPALHACGTGATDVTTLAVRADAAGRALTPTEGRAALRGAALLAAYATGRRDPDVPVEPPTAPTLSPDPDHQSWYAGQRRRYRDLYRSTRHLTDHP